MTSMNRERIVLHRWVSRLVVAALTVSTASVVGPVASGPVAAQPAVDVPTVDVVSWDDDPWLAVTDRLILVPLFGPLTADGAQRFDQILGVGPQRIFTMGDGQSQVYSLGEEVSLDEARARGAALVAEGFAARAEPDYRVRRASAPVNDTFWDLQWHLKAVSADNYGIDVAGLWASTTGSASTVVAVVDTGVTAHPDLDPRNIPVAGQNYPYGYDMISDDSIARRPSNTGRNPDPTDRGDWNEANECGSASNSSWHGTHVAGTIGAATNNSEGVAGIDQQARLVHVRVLGKCGGFLSDVADGIRWAAGLNVGAIAGSAHPARVINLSLGAQTEPCPAYLQSAISDAVAAKAIVIAAAGNANSTTSAFSPANCDGVITVAATTKAGARASYSNYDARVDIAAPGGGNGSFVWSTYNSGTTESAGPNYAGLQGTSMAAPHVAGVVALMLSLSPNLTWSEVRALLQSTATPFPVATDQDIGPGILNAGALYVGPPTGVTATEGEPRSATVTWNAAPSPANTLIGYIVTPHIAGVAQPGLAQSLNSEATGVTFETLANGTAYTFVVESLYVDNSRYASVPSNEVTPYDVPDAPAGVVVEPRDGGVQVNWTAPNTDGGRPITEYVVAVTQVGAGSTVTVAVPATSTSALVSGLTNGTSYTATVGATNLRGTRSSTPSDAVTPAGAPGTPSIVSTTPGLDYIDVTWTVPSTGGVDLLSVDLEVQPSVGSVLLFSELPGVSTSARVGSGGLGGTALSGGVSYQFRVRATNQNGLVSAYSALSDPVSPVGTTDPPELQSVTPFAIAPGGGDIELVGSGLNGVTNVRFVNCAAGVTTSAAPSSVTQGSVSVTAPACSPGNVAVYVERAGAVSNTVTLRYRSVPTIDSLSSSTVSALGGSLTVTGTGFVTDEMWVTVGHQVVSGSAVTVGGDGTTATVALSALTNVSQLGTVGVTVSVLNLAEFTVGTPALSYVKAPNTVTVSAATPIAYQFGKTLPVQAGAVGGTITYTGGGVCTFEDHDVALARITGAGTCTLTATASESDFVLAGSASFEVTVDPGTQTLAFWLPGRATLSAESVTVPLTAIRLSPLDNEGGGEIGFEIIGGAGTVCTVVNGAGGPELELLAVGTCTVRATVSATPDFLAGGSASVSMVVAPVPTITSVTPAFVSSAGGTTVTISGSALFVTEVADPVQLSCGGVSVSATSVVFDGTTSAVAVMPACATIGASHLRVTTSDGSVEFPITVVRAPTITAVSPDFAALGTTPVITITGTGFVVDATTVRLGAGSDITASVAEGGTSLTFTAPSSVAIDLLVDITVTVGGVASATAEGIFAYQDVPSRPVTVSATAGNQQVELSWAAATPNARSLDGYVVLQAEGAAESPVWTEIVTVLASTRQHIVTGLTNGTSYRFAVLGYNEVGRGESTVSALATPFTQAAAPTALTTAVQSPGNGVGPGQVVLTWTEGDLGGSALVRHDVEVSLDGSSWSSATAQFEGAVATVSGLTNGVTYQLRVRAVTEAGPGLWSDAASATPRDVPNAPAILAVEAKTPTNGLSGTEVLLTWAASVSNGAVVTDYIVERSDGDGWTPAEATISGTTATVSGLTPGEQISLRVLAVNEAGTSAPSTPVAATARDVPGSPGDISAVVKTPGNGVPGGALRITWTAPTVTNGALVTSYLVVAVTASAGTDVAASCEATAPTTQCDLVGLVNGAIYEVSVAAVNSAGLSLPGALNGTASPRDVPGAPGAPTLAVKNVDNEVPGGGLKVTWSAPTSDNGDAIVDYEVVVTVAGVIVASDIVSGLERTFSGLTSGVVHSVTVAARNGAGWSPPSDPTTETVRDVPGAPTEVAATPISAVGSQVDGVLRVSWSASSANGAAIDRYDVTVSATGQATKYCDTNGSTFSCDIDGLMLGVAYTVSVSATNAAGMSVEATTTGTPRAVPAAPAAPTVSAKTPTNGVAGGQVVVTWDEPDDRGDPITAYEVTTSTTEGGDYSVPASITMTGTTATISGLTNGVAVFVKVAAINAAGTSSASPATSGTPRTVPGVPAAPVLEVKTPLNGVAATELKATWAVPSVTNGAEVTDYEVVVSAAGVVVATHTGSGTTHTFTGLTVGTEYSVTVAALNAAGWSPASLPSTATARDVPNAPVAPTLVVKAPSNDVPDAGLRVSWTAPHSNGAPITQYEVVVSAAGVVVATHTGSGTTHTFTGLTVGTEYSVTVAALNAAGWSAGSDATTGTPVAVPGAPTGLQATAKSPTNGLSATELLLTWTAPVENGGTDVTGYVVEGSTDNVSWAPATATITGTTATVSGLTTGAPAYLRVFAVNAAGTSAASTAVSATPIDVPGAPTDVAAVGRTPTNVLSGTALRVTWTAPASNGGDAITSYKVVATKVGTSDFSVCTITAPNTQCDVSGLEAVTEYDIVVVAVNGAGTSSASTPVVRASTRDVPDTMAAPTVEAMTSSNGLSSGQLRVIWLEPVSNGAAVTSYTATASATGQTPRACTVAAPTLTCTISGLADGVAYSVVVSAVNAAGTSTASAATSATPRTVPGAPTGITLTVRNTTPEGVWNGVGDDAIKVEWSAPASDGSDAISGYTATASAAGQPDSACTTAALTCTITGLTVGVAYSVTVVATNFAGTGPSGAAASPARPLAVPGAPTDVVAVRGDTQLTVTWVAPTLSARGGANIVGYVAQATSGGAGATCTTTGAASCVISGLTNGSAYTVTVAAVNSAGRGADSDPSADVTPAAVPSAPATVSAVVAGSGELSVSWATATANGSAVTTYSATSVPGGITCSTSGTSCVVGGLTNGTLYTFTVVATNAVGDSVASAASAGVAPVGLPSAPLRVVALPTSSALVVTWEAPVDTGGESILHGHGQCRRPA
jgi:large repetitive protein